MRSLLILFFLYLTSVLACNNMFEDISLYGNVKPEVDIYILQQGEPKHIYISKDYGASFSEIQTINDTNTCTVNNLGHLLTFETSDSNDSYARLLIPGENIFTLKTLTLPDTFISLTASPQGDFYIITEESSQYYLYKIPANQRQAIMISSLSIPATIYGMWVVEHNNTEYIYVLQNNSGYYLWRSVDGGLSFTSTPTLFMFQINDIISYKNRIYAYIDDTNNPLHTSSDGLNFIPTSFPPGNSILALHVDNRNRMYLVTSSRIYFSDDGETWQEGTNADGSPTIGDVDSDYTDRLYILSGNSLYVSDDGGITSFPLNVTIGGNNLFVVSYIP